MDSYDRLTRTKTAHWIDVNLPFHTILAFFDPCSFFYLSHSMWYLWLFFFTAVRMWTGKYLFTSVWFPLFYRKELNMNITLYYVENQNNHSYSHTNTASVVRLYFVFMSMDNYWRKEKTKKKSFRSRPSEHNRIASLYLYTHKKKWFRSAAEFDENSMKQIEKSGYYDVATTDEEACVSLRPKCEKRLKRGSFWRTKLILNLQWFFLNSFVFSLFISKTTKIIAFEWEYYEGFPLQSRRKLKKEKKYFYPLKALHSS